MTARSVGIGSHMTFSLFGTAKIITKHSPEQQCPTLGCTGHFAVRIPFLHPDPPVGFHNLKILYQPGQNRLCLFPECFGQSSAISSTVRFPSQWDRTKLPRRIQFHLDFGWAVSTSGQTAAPASCPGKPADLAAEGSRQSSCWPSQGLQPSKTFF